MRNILLVGVVGALLLSGCSAPAPTKTSLEIQAIQSQHFDSNKKVVFNATMSVLQDLGFIIQSASLSTGFITANSPIKKEYSFLSILGGVSSQKNTAVTASVEEITSKQSKVRLNFVYRSSNSSQYGQTSAEDEPILDPKVYEDAFNKIGEAVFIRSKS